METNLSTAHKRYIRNEVLLGCVINALLAFAFTFMLFRNNAQIGLWGGDGIALERFGAEAARHLVGSREHDQPVHTFD